MAANYTINFTDPSQGSFIVSSIDLNQDTSLDLPGRGRVNWGENLHENSLHLLENFSSPQYFSSPTQPDPMYVRPPWVRGQLWHNSTDGELYVYTNNGSPIGWVPLLSVGTFESTLDPVYLRLDTANNPLTGTLQLPNGTASKPAYSFSSFNDTDTGMYLSATNELSFSINSSRRVSMSTEGIEVISTDYQKHLRIIRDAGTDEIWEITPSTDGSLDFIQTSTASGADAGYIQIISGGIKVGDGSATSPSFKFNTSTNTGMFSASGNTVGLTAGGTERFRAHTTGVTVFGTTTLNTVAYTWPSAVGSSGYTLSTNGSGVLSWSSANSLLTYPLLAPSGLTPVYSFSDDPTAGMWREGSNLNFRAGTQVNMAANGVNCLRLSSDYIGTYAGALELGIQANGVGPRDTYIDFHNTDSVNYDARIITYANNADLYLETRVGSDGDIVFMPSGSNYIYVHHGTANLEMVQHKIRGLEAGTDGSDAVNLTQLNAAVAAGSGSISIKRGEVSHGTHITGFSGKTNYYMITGFKFPGAASSMWASQGDKAVRQVYIHAPDTTDSTGGVVQCKTVREGSYGEGYGTAYYVVIGV